MNSENIYLIKLDDKKESFFKIGLSVHRYCRFYEIMKSGYSCEIIFMIFGIDCYVAFALEKHLQSLYHQYEPRKKFGGHRECFTCIDIANFKDNIYRVCGYTHEVVENLKIDWR